MKYIGLVKIIKRMTDFIVTNKDNQNRIIVKTS